MKIKKNLIIMLNLLLILMAMSYMDTKSNLAISETDSLNIPVDGQVDTSGNEVNANMYTLENKLVGKKEKRMDF